MRQGAWSLFNSSRSGPRAGAPNSRSATSTCPSNNESPQLAPPPQLPSSATVSRPASCAPSSSAAQQGREHVERQLVAAATHASLAQRVLGVSHLGRHQQGQIGRAPAVDELAAGLQVERRVAGTLPLQFQRQVLSRVLAPRRAIVDRGLAAGQLDRHAHRGVGPPPGVSSGRSKSSTLLPSSRSTTCASGWSISNWPKSWRLASKAHSGLSPRTAATSSHDFAGRIARHDSRHR